MHVHIRLIIISEVYGQLVLGIVFNDIRTRYFSLLSVSGDPEVS